MLLEFCFTFLGPRNGRFEDATLKIFIKLHNVILDKPFLERRSKYVTVAFKFATVKFKFKVAALLFQGY